MPVLEIPDPSLVVLIGAAGSGKSTFAAHHFAPEQILSSDAFRALISGDAADQRASARVFGLLHSSVVRRLAAGRLTIVDATNVERHARLALIRRAAGAGIPLIAVVLDLDPAIVLDRNAGRSSRVVDEAVVRRHLAAIRRSVDAGGLAAEGFAQVLVLRTPAELDATRIVIRARAT